MFVPLLLQDGVKFVINAAEDQVHGLFELLIGTDDVGQLLGEGLDLVIAHQRLEIAVNHYPGTLKAEL